jgi:hypothetical protein
MELLNLNGIIAAGEPLAGRLGASGAEALLHAYGNTVNRVLPDSPIYT